MEWKRWLDTLLQGITSCYFLLGTEWLFFATKPSFLSNATGFELAEVLLISPLILSAWVIAAVGALCALAAILPFRLFRRTLHHVARFAPAILLTAAALLLVDNFTYTVFGWGIVSSNAITGVAYLLTLGSCFWFVYRSLLRHDVRYSSHLSHLLVSVCAALLLLSSLSLATEQLRRQSGSAEASLAGGQVSSLPSIFFLGADGLSASHLSAYGYERETTPSLSEFAEHATLFENAFPNCAHTGCSFASMLTGRLPTETRLIYPPDILSGEDSFRHIPGVLRQLGYKNAAITIRHYGDPFELNLRESFDQANSRSLDSSRVSILPEFLGKTFNSEEYLLNRVATRISDRTLHLLGIRPMTDAFQQVTGKRTGLQRDTMRFDELVRFLELNPDPVFVHLHLNGTHGPRFHPKRRAFSLGKEQISGWMNDFYDDAVVDADSTIGKVLHYLKRHHRFRNSLIAILSDHGRGFARDERIPLLIKFPQQTEPMRVSQNVQLLDLAPTILDTLGFQIPPYMQGASLRGPGLDPLRPIFTVRSNSAYYHGATKWWSRSRARSSIAPLGHINLIHCDRKYNLAVQKNELKEQRVSGHTAPCDGGRLPTADEALQRIKAHLAERGYEPTDGPG